MGNFRDYLTSKDYFNKLHKIISEADRIISEKDEELENLTDTTDIDNDVVNAQEQAKKQKSKKVNDSENNKEKTDSDTTDDSDETDDYDTEDTDDSDSDTEDTDDSDTEDTDDSEDSDSNKSKNTETNNDSNLSKTQQRIEKKTFKNALKSTFFKKIKRLCNKVNFKNIVNNPENGFEIPKDKKSISFSQLKPVTCGYTITFAEFENNPKVKGDLSKLNEIVLSDEKSIISLSSDYFGISFFNRNDFVITDTNDDDYAENLFNGIVEELKNTEKLTYDCLKTSVLNKIKKDQNINDDVLLGYMRVYNFANYVSKNVIEDFYKNKEIPIIVTDNDNLMIDNAEEVDDSSK